MDLAKVVGRHERALEDGRSGYGVRNGTVLQSFDPKECQSRSGPGTVAQSGPGQMALQLGKSSHTKPPGALPVAVRQFHPCGVAVRPSDGCLLYSETSGD